LNIRIKKLKSPSWYERVLQFRLARSY